MRRSTAAFSRRAVALSFASSAVLAAVGLAACAKDASDATNPGEDDAGGSTVPDSFVLYDTRLPESDGYVPPPPDFDSYVPPVDTGPPPPPACGTTGQRCTVDVGDCPFPLECMKSVLAVDAGDAGGDADPDVDAAPPPDGVCVSGFDLFDCAGGACGGGSRCLLAANKCIGQAEIPCVCGDGGAGSPCGP